MDDNLRKQVNEYYQMGKVSIQDIARILRLSVPEVLEAIGEGDMSTVTIGGDLIDPSEAGPGAQMNYGQTVNVPFTTD
jgi:hypothetical protein